MIYMTFGRKHCAPTEVFLDLIDNLKFAMPEISHFLGIIITMYYNDHTPAHFHVRYNQQKAIIDIKNLTILQGQLSPRILGLVIEWAAIHQQELKENWQLARLNEPLQPILPLE